MRYLKCNALPKIIVFEDSDFSQFKSSLMLRVKGYKAVV